MKVLFATSELAPWVKTGGLGDVAAALPPALRQTGADVRVLVPFYPALRQAFPDAAPWAAVPPLGGRLGGALLRSARTPDGTPLLLLEHNDHYDRPGNPYLGADNRDWPDNRLRFGLLSRVAAWLGSEACPGDWRCDLIHCNDWQTGLAPAYLRYLDELPGSAARAKSLITIHNLAFQGLFGADALPELGLPPESWALDGVEYHGYLSFLKAGLQHADAITTVSPSYAREIQTPAEGMGLDGLLRHRGERLTGILNGIDTELWNPATDACLHGHYDVLRLPQKVRNKSELRRELGLRPAEDRPLLGVVSRLTEQKGLDLLARTAEEILALPAQLVVLGHGDRALEQHFRNLALSHPQQVAVHIGFNEVLAHRIEAGIDLFLMPSRFEPCGLNQMYSQRYGTPPLVRATGGLADTVVDCTPATLAAGRASGFVFQAAEASAFLDCVRRAVAAWHDRRLWRQLQINGMTRDWSWQAPARAYHTLYQQLIGTL
ncbi:starch synthase [Denitratisoma sp. DHT3]|uniref:glycogen synthase GlgA n=1 Tax=Denitratisoma sp. DHT3 TaxID=1981880 RepID=UPI001198BCA0|nr:glycogen synthase GlgA [Denitratisoma sp. DHT3]QDX82333.1 starch synthase [Denitratisoma sp. DHT3]